MSMDERDDRLEIERLERIGATVCQLEAERDALKAELAAMTARAELAERQITLVQDERAASFARLDAAVGGTGLTEYQPEIATLIECAIKGIISAKELAERQVEEAWRVQVRNYGNATGTHLDLLAWANKSRAEAVKEGGKG
jgi:hypothetical protein